MSLGSSQMSKFAKCLCLVAGVIAVQVVLSGAASAAACKRSEVYSSSMGQCIPKNAGAETKVFIPHGCPYNLDKVCMRSQGGTLTRCRCVS
jgi:hypothetical protein